MLDEFPHDPPDLQPGAVDAGADSTNTPTARRPIRFWIARSRPPKILTESQRNFMTALFFSGQRAAHDLSLSRGIASCTKRTRTVFDRRTCAILQVLSQLVWFDEDLLRARSASCRSWSQKGRDYSLEDQAVMARKQREALAQVLPVYREFAARGQIEISTTPFYHPILPLICDSDIARGLASRRSAAHAVPLSRGRARAVAAARGPI